MDHYLSSYCTKTIAYNVFVYISWDELKEYDVSDFVWEKISHGYCEDVTFREYFDEYCKDLDGWSWKRRFLNFVNNLAMISRPAWDEVPAVLRRDRGFVWCRIPYDIDIWDGIGDELKSDRETGLRIFKSWGRLENIKMENLKDRAWIMEVIAERVYVLRYASDEIRDDREVVLKAMRTNPNALNYASDRLKEELRWLR